MRQSIGKLPSVGWVMVALAALAQNCALGLNFASYGTLIAAMEVRFDTSRALASSGLGAMVLSMSLCSPLVGGLLQRYSVRSVMIVGALLSAAGYALLPFVDSIYLVLAVFALLIGPGACFLGIVPAATLVGNWFIKDRGKALGVINMPILLFLMPPVFGYLLITLGLNGVFLTISALFLASTLFLFLVIDRPEDVGRAPRMADAGLGSATADAAAPLDKRALLRKPAFWLVSIGVGVLTSGSTMLVTHFVPFGTGRGFELNQAALLVSAFGGAGMFGALLFGWLVDRIGAVNTLIVNALAQGLLWMGLIPHSGLPAMLMLAASAGACAGAIVAIHGAALNELFGRASFSQAMGLSYLFKLPFIVFAAPFAGWLFDRTGTYQWPIIIHILAFALSALIFLRLAVAGRGATAQNAIKGASS